MASAMAGYGIIVSIVIGILAGYIASRIMGSGGGLLVDLLVGIVGAFLGPIVLGALGVLPANYASNIVISILVSTVGAVILLFILGLFRRRA